jgi:hypothetical protein
MFPVMMPVVLSQGPMDGDWKAQQSFATRTDRRISPMPSGVTAIGIACLDRIAGFIGERVIDYIVVREDRVWRLNGTALSGLGHLLDLDLGFTPATNIQQLRRVAIAENETVQLPVAWLDVDAGTLTELPQVYERRGPAAFWYQAPSFGYEGLLELAPNGFIRSYPNLWEAERSL